MIDDNQTVDAEFEPEQEFLFANLDTLKVVTDPTRLRILEALVQKALTVKEIAQRLGTTATKLYYHINMLEEHDLIKVVGQRVVSGIIEKRYRTRAYSFRVDKSMFTLSPETEGAGVDVMLGAVLDATREDVRQAIEQGLMTPGHDDPVIRNSVLMRAITRMKPERIREFEKRLAELIEEFQSIEDSKEKDNDGSNLVSYGFTVALFPFAANQPNSRTIID